MNIEVVLRRVLGTHVGLELAIEKDGPEEREVHWGTTLRVQETTERIGINNSVIAEILTKKRVLQKRAIDKRTASEWGLGAELLQDQLLDRVIEQSPAGANVGFSRGTGTPRDADTGCKSLPIRLG